MMMVLQRRQWMLMAILLTTWMVGGCGRKSMPVTYYTLNPLSYEAPDRPPAQALADQVFGIGPIHLPDYLDRVQIVSRTSPNRLRINDFQRWAAPLDKDMTRVLAENIKQLTGVENCMAYPWPTNPGPGITMTLTVHAFEALPDGRMVLNATMILLDRRSRLSTPQYRTFYIARPFTAVDDITAVVAAQNQVFDDLSRQIAEAVITLVQ